MKVPNNQVEWLDQPQVDETAMAMATAIEHAREKKLFEQGKEMLQQRMGGKVPWYKEKGSPNLGMASQKGQMRDIQDAVQGKEPDLSYAKPGDDWNIITQYNGQMIDPNKLSPKHLKFLKSKGIKLD